MTPDKVVRNFNRCADWEERYLYLIELGDRLEEFPVDKLTDDYIVRGCQSQVWMEQYYQDSQLVINATSDAALVRGLISLIVIAYRGKSAEQVLMFDVTSWFKELQLDSHLTVSRTQGLEAIVTAVKTKAASLEGQA